MIFLPNNILSAKRFTIEDKVLLIGRERQNQTVCIAYPLPWYSKLTQLGHLEPHHQMVPDPRSTRGSPSMASIPLHTSERNHQRRIRQCKSIPLVSQTHKHNWLIRIVWKTHHKRPRLQLTPHNSPRNPPRSLPGRFHPERVLSRNSLQKYPYDHHGRLSHSHYSRHEPSLEIPTKRQWVRGIIWLLHRMPFPSPSP